MFEFVLQRIFSTDGVEGVVFSDSEGEPVFSYGAQGTDQLHLLSAYQGILLNAIERLTDRKHHTVITVCDERTILTHQLKDGYFISVLLSENVNFSHIQFMFQDFYAAILKEL